MAINSVDRELRLRIHIGTSPFDNRSIILWSHREGKKSKKIHNHNGNDGHEIFLPLIPRQIIIADSDISRQPQPIEGEVYVISHGIHGWTVNDSLIGESREHAPQTLASRELIFDVVKTRNVEA